MSKKNVAILIIVCLTCFFLLLPLDILAQGVKEATSEGSIKLYKAIESTISSEVSEMDSFEKASEILLKRLDASVKRMTVISEKILSRIEEIKKTNSKVKEMEEDSNRLQEEIEDLIDEHSKVKDLYADLSEAKDFKKSYSSFKKQVGIVKDSLESVLENEGDIVSELKEYDVATTSAKSSSE